MERMDFQREIFGMLFKTSNGLQVYLDHLLKPDKLTAKQMFLMIVINTFGEADPTLKEVAERSSSSYQNVKQLAMKLEKAGFVEIGTDDHDRRRKQLKLTQKAESYWSQRSSGDILEMNRLFDGCSDEDLQAFLRVINHIQNNMAGM